MSCKQQKPRKKHNKKIFPQAHIQTLWILLRSWICTGSQVSQYRGLRDSCCELKEGREASLIRTSESVAFCSTSTIIHTAQKHGGNCTSNRRACRHPLACFYPHQPQSCRVPLQSYNAGIFHSTKRGMREGKATERTYQTKRGSELRYSVTSITTLSSP